MNKSRSYKVFQVFNTILMITVVFATLYPFVYLVAQSFSSEAAIYAGKVTFYPVEFTTSTYKSILSNPNFYRYYLNTFIYAIVGTFISVGGTAILAYPLSKKRLLLNKYITPFVVFTMFFAGGMIPNYLLVARVLGLRDTMWAVILPGAISVYYMLIMKAFFVSLPEELEEAAAVDGMGAYGIFFKIILPLSKPILATMLLFYMVGIWNNWFGPFLYLDTKDKWPIALYLRQVIDSAVNPNELGASSEEVGQIAATIKSATMVLTAAPIIMVYPFIQKYFVQGMMIGSVKG